MQTDSTEQGLLNDLLESWQAQQAPFTDQSLQAFLNWLDAAFVELRPEVQPVFEQLYQTWQTRTGTRASQSREAFVKWAKSLAAPQLEKATQKQGSESINHDEQAHIAEPQQAGPYRLQRCIGEGGMGKVYLGVRQDDTEHKAAIKVLSITGKQSEKLSKEAQILAGLRHRHIAHFLSSGRLNDGRPWIALEYVEGLPLDAWIAQERPSLERRIQLFLAIAEAVSHAHQNLIIHRDLKPSNIIVDTEGQPKLLDFGIASVLNPDTREQQTMTHLANLVMTPEYASPEQVMGQRLSVATDIYSLGIVLYEILTGARPYNVARQSTLELVNSICNSPITQPSRMSRKQKSEVALPTRLLRGDLDIIVMKALERTPEHRYTTVADMLEDLRRFDEGLPIKARPTSTWYRMRKFASRNYWRLAFVLLLFATLLGFFVAGRMQTRELQKQAERIAQERDRAEQITQFIVSLFEEVDPNRSGVKPLTALDVMDLGRERIGNELGTTPQTKAHLLLTMGQLYRGLGNYQVAEILLQEAHELTALEDDFEIAYQLVLTLESAGKYHQALKLLESAPLSTADTDYRRGMVAFSHGRLLFYLGHYLKVGNYYDRASKLIPEDHEKDHNALLRHRVFLDAAVGKTEGSIQLLHDLLIRLKRRHQGPHTDIAEATMELGNQYMTLQDFEKAKEYFDQGETLYRELVGEAHPQIVNCYFLKGRLYQNWGDNDLAETYYNKALKLSESVFSENHPRVIQLIIDISEIKQLYGDFKSAEAGFRKALTMAEAHSNEATPILAHAKKSFASLHLAKGENETSLRLYQDVLKIYKTLHGERHRNVAEIYGLIANNYKALGQLTKAKVFAEKGIEQMVTMYGDDHDMVGWSKSRLAEVLIALGQPQEAEPLLRDALAQARALYNPDHFRISTSLGLLAHALKQTAKYEEALDLLRELRSIYQRLYDENSHYVRSTDNLIGLTLTKMGAYDKADVVFKRLVEASRKHDQLSYQSSYLNNYGRNLEAQGDYQKALEMLLACHQIDLETIGNKHYYTAISAYSVANCLFHLKQFSEARQYIDRSLEIFYRELPENHWRIAVARNIQAAIMIAQGNREEGIPQFKASFEQIEENHKNQAQDKVSSAQKRMKLLESMTSETIQNP